MVVQYNFCNRHFVTDHKFSMGLRSGECPGQSTVTHSFCFLKTVFTFQMKDTGHNPVGIFLHHQEVSFKYLE